MNKKIIIAIVILIIIGVSYFKFDYANLFNNKSVLNSSVVLPKFDEINEKEHYNFISTIIKESSSDDEKWIKLQEYVNSLDLKNLLLAMAEIADEDEEGLMIFANASKKILLELDTDTYVSIITNKKYPMGFRYIMIEIMNNNTVGARLIKKDITPKISALMKDHIKIMKILRTIITNVDEHESLQLISLTTIDNYTKKDISLFETIFNSDKYSDTLKGWALKTLFEFNKDSAYKRIEKILAQPEEYSEFEIETARDLKKSIHN